MTITHRGFSLHTALIILAVLTPIAFLSALPWLDSQPDWVVLSLGGAAALIEIVSAFALTALKDRKADEWHRGATRFGAHWGWLVGAGVVPLLITLPPFQGLVIAFATNIDPDAQVTEKMALMTFLAGFMTVVMLQAIFSAVFSLTWRMWMSRAI